MPVYPGAQTIDSLFGREPELRKYGGPMTFFNKLLGEQNVSLSFSLLDIVSRFATPVHLTERVPLSALGSLSQKR
jgi:hypothetical protein